ncbi:shootin-1-like isoform X1 [Anomalospiza imberbis]|uniref:shootin-1-like isoform X1 n=1 Tax=Anomalospiza imberbis TaxID=187417 RepID=UPI00358F6598
MAWAGDGVGGHLAVLARVPAAILESGSSEEEEEDEEAAPGQHPALDPVPDDTETRLAQLEQASQALLAELAALDTEVELEQRCQQRAQAFSVQVGVGTGPQNGPFVGTKVLGHPWGTPGLGARGEPQFWDSGILVEQENVRLERISLAGTPKGTPGEVTPVMNPEVAPEEVTPTGVALEEPPTPAQLPAPQENLSQLLEQHQDLRVQLQHLHAQLELEREQQQRLRAALAASQRALRSFKRVSQIVTQDYCQALEQLELEQDLRCHAEAFARQMLVQQKEAKRQSSILLRSAAPDSQILEALQQLEKLSQELEEMQQERHQREMELEQEREELQRAREALEEAREEKRELRERLEGLEKEVGSLREQLAQRPPPQSHPEVPPPPPLPPPAATAVPDDPLAALRQRKARKNREQSDPGTEDIRARAVQEMLERIRSGIVLRPARARPPPCQDSTASKRRSAALELQGILGALRRPSRRRSRKSRDQQMGSVLELGSILERRRRALDASMGNSMGNQSMGNSMGTKSTGTNSMGNHSKGTNSMGNQSMGNHSKGTNSMRNSMGTNSMENHSKGTNSMGNQSMGNSMGTNSMSTKSMGNSMSMNSMGTKSMGTNSMWNSMGTSSMGSSSMGNSMDTNSMGNPSMGTNTTGNSAGTNSKSTNSMGNSMGTNSMGNSVGTDSKGTNSTGANPTRNSTGAQEQDGAGKEPDAGTELGMSPRRARR